MRKSMVVTMVVLLLFLSLPGGAPGQAKPPKKTPELINEGKKLYEVNCTPCHGPKGEGKGPAAAALKPPPSDFAQPLKDWPNTKGSPEKVFQVISKGIQGSAMVGWPQFSEKERWGLAYFVMDFATKKK